MISNLYGSTESFRARSDSSTRFSEYYGKRQFERIVKEQQNLNINYWSYLFYWALSSICCCFKRCCNLSPKIKAGTYRYEKIAIALDRLAKEQDIQYII